MSGIDTSAAALQVNRTGALSPVGTGASAGPVQTGVSALAGGVPDLPDVPGASPQQASAQTVLSAVALALDAIVRSGGDATPAVVGTAPVWPDPDAAPAAGAQPAADARLAADAAALGLLTALADALPEATGADGADGASPDGTTSANAAAQTAAAAARSGDPIAALAASLQRTVSGSGLFYESHLAQWLLGQRSPAELAAEPQNRLVASAAAPLPPDWQRGAGTADDVFWTDPREASAPSPAGGGPDPARAAPGHAANPAQAALFDDGLLDMPAASSPGSLARDGAGGAALPLTNPQGQPAAVHPAVIPLLRQQLDVLATGEFRWTGDAWPGVRLDWSIRQEGDEPRHGHAASDPDTTPWRTRLTLSLPSLGIVDADLTLVGATLAVRVQASAEGAARLAANGDALRGRMAAAGIELGGLSIREVGAGAPGGGADAARAAHAYAQAAGAAGSAATATSAPADAPPPTAASGDLFDWDAR